MKLHCLGTAGYHPNEMRQTSCYFIPQKRIVLDAGSGFFRVGPLLEGDTLHILLSHAHLDHVFGLTFVYDLFAVTPLRHVHVYAQQVKIDAIQNHLFNEHLFPILPPLEWHALEDLGESFQIEETEVGWFPLEHPGGSTGFRLDWKASSLAYITDTTSQKDAPYWEEIQGVEWLLHECNFSDKYRDLAMRTGHSWTTAVLEGAAKTRIPRLLLSHFNPLEVDKDPIDLETSCTDELRSCFEQILLATDKLTVDLV